MPCRETAALASVAVAVTALLLASILGAVPNNVEPDNAWIAGKEASSLWALSVASMLLGTIAGGLWTTALVAGHGKLLAAVTQPVCGLLLLVAVLVLAVDGARVVEAVLVGAVLVVDMLWMARARRRIASAGAHLATLGKGLGANRLLRPFIAASVLATAGIVIVWCGAVLAAVRGGGSAGGVGFLLVVSLVVLRYLTSFVRMVPSIAVAGSFFEHLARLAAREGSSLRVSPSTGLLDATGGPLNGAPTSSSPAGHPEVAADQGALTEVTTEQAAATEGAIATAAASEDDIDLEALVAQEQGAATLAAAAAADDDDDDEAVRLPSSLQVGPRRRCVEAVSGSLPAAAYAAALAIPGPLLWPLQGCLARRSPAVRRAARAGHALPLVQVALTRCGWDAARLPLWAAVDTSGADAAIDDDMTPRLLALASTAAALIVALVTGSLGSGPGWGLRALAATLPAMAGAAACLSPVEAAAATLLAAFATAPAAVAAANPLVYHRLARLAEARRTARG